MTRRNNEKHFGCARMMPALKHTDSTSKYDITRSEVAKWLCSQPSIMQYVFDLVRRSKDDDGNPFIVYDIDEMSWVGTNVRDQR